MIPRNVERIGGLIVALLGGWLTWFAWQAAHQQKSFLSVGATGPAFVLLGLSLLRFPSPKSERAARGVPENSPESWSELSPHWKIICGICCALAAGYFLLLACGP